MESSHTPRESTWSAQFVRSAPPARSASFVRSRARSARAARRSAELRWLRTRLRKTHALFDSLPAPDINLPWNLRKILRWLLKRGDAILRAIHRRTCRSLGSKLTIERLPIELLLMIFKEVVEHAFLRSRRQGKCPAGDIEFREVQNLRLTCRHFWENSSHLLMSAVFVTLVKPRSIGVLEQVSRHPTISKSVRSVNIQLGQYFDGHIARNFRSFAQYHASRLLDDVRQWTEDLETDLADDPDDPILVEEQTLINRATALANLWEAAASRGVDNNCPEHVMLKMAHFQYQRCYGDQLILQRGVLAQSVATAMARMPNARTLCIVPGRSPRTSLDYDQPDSDIFTPRLFSVESRRKLRLVLQAPLGDWSYHTRSTYLDKPPGDMIPSILSDILEADICLKELDIRLPLRENITGLSLFSTTQPGRPKLRAVLQQMETFRYSPDEFGVFRGRSREARVLFQRCLSSSLDTSALQRVDLRFEPDHLEYQYTNGIRMLRPPTLSEAPILFSRCWPNLKELRFQGPFYLEELLRIVHRVGKDVWLHWSGYLMDRSWAELLDLLRDLDSRDNFHLGCGLANGMAGAEYIQDLNIGDFNLLHQWPWSEENPHEHTACSWATHFVRGSSNKNPYRLWAEGKLHA